MKVKITPEEVKLHTMQKAEATCTIGRGNICFNLKAANMLALTSGNKFKFEFEDGSLYYLDAQDEDSFTLSKTGKNMYVCRINGIRAYLETFFKKELAQYKFEIGEFKDGRRRLSLINSNK